jgi:zinc protease
MMFRGTERYPAERYQRILTELGADANAYTTDDLTAYHIASAAEDLAQVMTLESDRFKYLDYPERDFKTEAGAVYGEYRKEKTDPLFVLYEAVREAAFDRHSYGHTTLGYEADIAIMPTLYEYSRAFFRRYYRPENSVIFVVGDIDSEQVLALTEQHYGDWQMGYETPPVEPEPEQMHEKRIDVSYDGRTLPMLWHAYKIGRFDPGDRIRVAADLLVELAFGETSKIYQRLVLRDQSVEFLSAYTNMNRDASVLDIYCRVKDPSKVDQVDSAINATAAEFRQTQVSPEKLRELQSRLRYGFLMQLETPDAVAESFARPIALSGGLSDHEALYAAYARVTPDDIRDAANAILIEGGRTVGLLRGQHV